jgi:predicted aconitase with swiveling domain
MAVTHVSIARSILPGAAEGPVIASEEALSFWGGVDPATGRVIDVRHPLRGVCIAGRVVMIPSSRGSCSGSGVLLDLMLAGRAPAALVFSEAEDVLTLGALVASEMFGKRLPVLRLAPIAFRALGRAKAARIGEGAIEADGLTIPVAPPCSRIAPVRSAVPPDSSR